MAEQEIRPALSVLKAGAGEMDVDKSHNIYTMCQTKLKCF